MKHLCCCLALFLGFACSPAKRTAADGTSALSELTTAMTGSFNSSAQARGNDAYYHIVLHMQPIWPEEDGTYLYVEQAVADATDQPYRQRVYRLEQRGKRLISHVYELPEPERFVGAHENPARLAALSPADLVEREGCAVYLKKDKSGIYRGQTRKKTCKSSLRGATYATSRVSIAGNFIQSWDRGYNEADEQVWGATEGGYMFFRE